MIMGLSGGRRNRLRQPRLPPPALVRVLWPALSRWPCYLKLERE